MTTYSPAHQIKNILHACTGESSGWGGGGVAGVATPALIKIDRGHPRGHCDRITRVAVVGDLVVTSSNNAYLCALNSFAVGIKPIVFFIATSGSLRSRDPERV